MQGCIFDLRRYSIHDGPGIRTTVFFKGCPLRCWWCHNPESRARSVEIVWRAGRCLSCGRCQEACPHEAITLEEGVPSADAQRCQLCGECAAACPSEARQMVGRWVTAAAVLDEIERDIPFFDQSGGGVTFSGGEPLWQPEFLLALLQGCRQRELHTALDTCGSAPWEVIEALRPYVSLFLYDIKLVDEQQHLQYTGASNRLILQNLVRLAQQGAPLLLRLPVIPGITGTPENLRQVGTFVAALPGSVPLELLPYHQTAQAKYERLGLSYLLDGLQAPSGVQMLEAAALLQGMGVQVLGLERFEPME